LFPFLGASNSHFRLVIESGLVIVSETIAHLGQPSVPVRIGLQAVAILTVAAILLEVAAVLLEAAGYFLSSFRFARKEWRYTFKKRR
jgi:hypothetical protein